MRKQAVLVLAVSLLAGCTAVSDWWQRAKLPWENGTHSNPSPPAANAEKPEHKRNQELAQDKTPAQARTKGTLPRGGADEALFRSALHALKPSNDLPVSPRGRELLRRLKKEYPASPWTALAAPLLDLIRVTDELSQRNQSLKTNNDSLAKEVNQLNQNIKQLKSLDQELEKARLSH